MLLFLLLLRSCPPDILHSDIATDSLCCWDEPGLSFLNTVALFSKASSFPALLVSYGPAVRTQSLEERLSCQQREINNELITKANVIELSKFSHFNDT